MTVRSEVAPSAALSARMVTRAHERFVLVWHGTEAPSQAEWDEAVGVVDRQASRPLRVLVFTEGGGPSISQQQQLHAALSGKSPMIAVLSDHVGVRFVASSLALFVRQIRTFRADELSQACVQLGLEPAERSLVVAFAEEQRRKPRPT